MPTVKCLSVSQPFAYLIVKGKKTIELRRWNTKFRGEFFVHAPIKIRTSDCRRLGIDEGALPAGAIVGKAVIYDVKKYQTKKELRADQRFHFATLDFADARFGFMLKSAKEFKVPIPCKGRLGFFDVPLEKNKTKDSDITSEIFDEEYRTRWINHH